MRVLIACEFSGIVRDAFIARGHEVLSCDLLPTEREGSHYQGDVRDVIYDGWDMMIAFPPCTYLSYAGNRHWNNPGREEKRREALTFVRFLMDAPIARIAIENPKGCISRYIRKEDQIITPYNFGHSEQKRTCLWLKNLPPLMVVCTYLNRKEFIIAMSPSLNRAKNRSRTFQGIALAMASQWT